MQQRPNILSKGLCLPRFLRVPREFFPRMDSPLAVVGNVCARHHEKPIARMTFRL